MVTGTPQHDPRWGAAQRDVKGQAIVTTLRHYVSEPLEELQVLDLGCGSGGIAATLAPHFKHVLGLDLEPWARWTDFQDQHNNLYFVQASAQALPLAGNSVDVIICNQVYEHVPDAQQLITGIYQLLKPGGYCYFAGPNLLFPIEPHVFWPFVHWLPREFAVRLMRFLGAQSVVDAYSVDYWTLQKWLWGFEIQNAVPHILRHPAEYAKKSLFWRVLSWLPTRLLYTLTWLSPGFVFVLRKPANLD